MNWGAISVAAGAVALMVAEPITAIILVPLAIFLWKTS